MERRMFGGPRMINGTISLSGDYKKIKKFLESDKDIKVSEIKPTFAVQEKSAP